MEVKSTFVLPNELKLNLNTEGHCLICLNQTCKSKTVKNEGNDEARNSTLLWELFHYLKINTEEIVSQFERTFVFSKTGKVSFCTRCIGLMENFTDLLKKLEEIQLEINQSLGKIKTEVCESFKNKEVNEAYSMRVTSNDESLDMFVLVDNLRKLISTKCPSVKLQNAERTPKTEDFAKSLPKTLKVPTTPTKFHCDLCPQKFKLSFLLARHKETFHYIKKFTCKFCSKIWTDRVEHELHEKQCPKSESPLEEEQDDFETETNEADADWILSDDEDKPKKKKIQENSKTWKVF